MSAVIEQMIKAYDEQPQQDKRNAMKEIMQEMVLCGLSRAEFFKKRPSMAARRCVSSTAWTGSLKTWIFP